MNAPFIDQEEAVADSGVTGYWCENGDNAVARSGIADTHATRRQSRRGRQNIMVPQCKAAPKAAGQSHCEARVSQRA